MITSKSPETWQELQASVTRILGQCGFAAETERTVRLARGEAAVDVYAEEVTDGRRNTIFCECKHWKAAIPQTVVHAFRTVVGDGGAIVGYLITSSRYQSGAFDASELRIFAS